jgi:flavin reductase (DIM6/NTAB) family NADH-FMN oxidoreductase RutF
MTTCRHRRAAYPAERPPSCYSCRNSRSIPGSEGALSIDPNEFRGIIGRFATGVTVVTAAHDGRFHGMTANAVTSVSLEPPMLLVCVAKTAHAHALITQSRAFAVNILGEEQEAVSSLFAQRSEPEAGRLQGAGFTIGGTGSPLLDDCAAYLECRVTEVFEGGDHSIFLGEVVAESIGNDGAPLVFFRGRYRSLSDEPPPS